LAAPQTMASGSGPRLDLAHRQARRIGMAVDLQHFSHHHPIERRCRRLYGLDFHAGHRQRVRELARGERRVDEGAEPVL
jgi:hypothetical protein